MSDTQKQFDLQSYLNAGVAGITGDIIKNTLSNPAESLFMAKYSLAAKRAQARRDEYERKGVHVPPFLIASITSSCNLHCRGCYARANHSCSDGAPVNQLDAQQWSGIFEQARSLGVSFILLAGGEPLVRRDVIEAAAGIKDIMFPVFTNGTLIDENYAQLFDKHRNLMPVISMEGGGATTDARRGEGTYDSVCRAMAELAKRRILTGTSVTVTRDNANEVTSGQFMAQLRSLGCKAVVYVEYVPTDPSTAELAPDAESRAAFDKKLAALRDEYSDIVFISFPGDERASGGCLAAGRGFFHINARGGAEPCPFSPYSDTSLKDVTLLDAIQSPLFTALQSGGMLLDDHAGGCVLFEKAEQVRALLK